MRFQEKWPLYWTHMLVKANGHLLSTTNCVAAAQYKQHVDRVNKSFYC